MIKKNIKLKKPKLNKKKRVLKAWFLPEVISKSSLENKKTSNSLPQPKKVHCFQCQTNFYIKFVIPQQNYSKKNNWDYWTGQKGSKKICNSCLKKLYYNKPVYWQTITDLKKRNLLKSYINIGHLA